MRDKTARVQIIPKLVPVFAGEADYRGAYGGRGSGKSRTFATMAAVRGYERPRRILCAREYQNSIKDSVHAEISRSIAAYDFLSAGYEIGESFIRSRCGSEFLFKGLRRNIAEIKSMSDIDICWVEEAENVSAESWRDLIPTIREAGAEIWATWNPRRIDSPTRELFLGNPPESIKVAKVNYTDNPWFGGKLERDRQRDARGDPDMYAHVWEGECVTRTDAQVLAGKWRRGELSPGKGWAGPYYGADWGFSVDPTALVRCWISPNERTLYIDHEAFGDNTPIDAIPDLFAQVPESDKHVIRADNSRPETIHHVRHHTRRPFPRLVAAAKWPGSVDDGVEYLRSFEDIVINPGCPRILDEARLWSYKIDRLTGDVLPVLLPGNDHGWDAVRYALEPIIRRRFSGVRGLQVPSL